MQAPLGARSLRSGLDALTDHSGAVVEIATHAPVYAQGDPAEHIYQVKSGCIGICSYEEEGRRLIHGFHVPGDIFGVEAGDHHASSAEAICPTRLACWDTRQLTRSWNENPSVALAFWQWRSSQQEQTVQRLSRIAHLDGVGRVLFFLADLARRTGDARRIELTMSRYDIADYLGLSSETVSRIFTRMKQQGIIALAGHCITIKASGVLAGDNDDGASNWQEFG